MLQLYNNFSCTLQEDIFTVQTICVEIHAQIFLEIVTKFEFFPAAKAKLSDF